MASFKSRQNGKTNRSYQLVYLSLAGALFLFLVLFGDEMINRQAHNSLSDISNLLCVSLSDVMCQRRQGRDHTGNWFVFHVLVVCWPINNGGGRICQLTNPSQATTFVQVCVHLYLLGIRWPKEVIIACYTRTAMTRSCEL